ncbi:MAG: hypothetical protein IT532_13710 [Burkholderiales bacterium]|nr:hypothetical protein [Burkholderiales bacterium]
MSRSALFVFCILLAALGSGCSTARLTGTAYSVTYRPAENELAQLGDVGQMIGVTSRRRAPARAADPAHGQRLLLVDGRSNAALATADYDGAAKWYFFQLPMNVALPDTGKLCLSLRTASGTPIPLRDEAREDDGYEFRHPIWESELRRAAELRADRSERARLEDEQILAKAELDAIEARYGARVVAGSEPCPLARAAAVPARPASALDERAARDAAPGLCALQWEQVLNAPAEALYRDAGRIADWGGRAAAKPHAAAFPGLRIVLGGGDLELARNAAVGGPLVLQHQKGLQVFDAGDRACQAEVMRMARDATAAWEQRVGDLGSAPERSRKRCETDIAKAPELRRRIQQAQAGERALGQRIASLEKAEPDAHAGSDLGQKGCAQ